MSDIQNIMTAKIINVSNDSLKTQVNDKVIISVNGNQLIIERLVSKYWTPNHIDVTDKLINYAKPKEFKFINKKQKRWIDSNRFFRQKSGVNRKIISVHELSSLNYSIDNRNNGK